MDPRSTSDQPPPTPPEQPPPTPSGPPPPAKRRADKPPEGQPGAKKQEVTQDQPLVAPVQAQPPVTPVLNTPTPPSTVTPENTSSSSAQPKDDSSNAIAVLLNNIMEDFRVESPVLFRQVNVIRECTDRVHEMKENLSEAHSSYSDSDELMERDELVYEEGVVLNFEDDFDEDDVLTPSSGDVLTLSSTVPQVRDQQPQTQSSEQLQVEQPVEHIEKPDPAEVIMGVGAFAHVNAIVNEFKIVGLAFHMLPKELAVQLSVTVKSNPSILKIKQSEKYLGTFKLLYAKSVLSCVVTNDKVIIQEITLASDDDLCRMWWSKITHPPKVNFGTGVSQTDIASSCGYANTSSIMAVQNWLKYGKDYKVTLNKSTAKFTITFSALIRQGGIRQDGYVLVGESAGPNTIKIIEYRRPRTLVDPSATPASSAAPQPSAEQRTLARYYREFLHLKLYILPGAGDKHLLGTSQGEREINNEIAGGPRWLNFEGMCEALVRYAHNNREMFSIVLDSQYVWKAVLNVGRSSTIMVSSDGAIFHAGPNIGGRQPTFEDETYKRL